MVNTNIIREVPGGIVFSVRIHPNAKRSGFAGFHGESVKIDVNAPPLEGKANKELIKFLSEALSVPKSSIQIVRGDKSKGKVLKLAGISSAKLLNALGTPET
jgi:uncharacterized protein (TIGR00251 family)